MIPSPMVAKPIPGDGQWILGMLEKTLISLKVYATEDADVIMNAISESNCRLEEFRFINSKS